MSKHRPIPPDVLDRFGNLPDHVYRGGGEHSSSCPQCGGARGGSDPSDRFRFWEREAGQACNFWCRRCGFDGFTDDNKPTYKPSPEKLAQIEETRRREAEREERRLRMKIEAIREAAYWKGWHDAMSEQQRDQWRQRGIHDYFIDYYSLGYHTDYTYYHDGQEWRTPALTIPHYDHGWELSNIQFRLQNVAPGAGKYRQTKGLPAAMFRTEPDDSLDRAALVVEGAIKSIVIYQHIGGKALGFPMSIVGLPSKTPSAAMLEQLKDCDPIYLLLDPDAYVDNSASSVVKKLGRGRVMVAKTPVKPDDLIVEYGGDADDLLHFLRQAVAA